MKNGKETKTIKKPSLYIAMPCYDMVKINTMISMVKLIAQLTKAGIKMEVNTMKSPYIAYARNILTAQALWKATMTICYLLTPTSSLNRNVLCECWWHRRISSAPLTELKRDDPFNYKIYYNGRRYTECNHSTWRTD